MRNLVFLQFIKRILPFIFLQFIAVLYAQEVTIVGRVTIFNSSKPLRSVIVKAEGVKNQQDETSDKGIFKIILEEPIEGKRYKINLCKKDYEVVNEESLFAVAGQTDTLELKMVISNELADARQKYYKVFGTSFEIKAREKITDLRIKLKEEKGKTIRDEKRIKVLKAELDNAEEQLASANQKVQELAKVLSYVSTDNEPEIFVSALEKLKSGEITIDSACEQIGNGISTLDSLIRHDYYNQETNLAKKAIKWRVVKMLLYKSQLRFDDLNNEFQKIEQYKFVEQEQAQLFLDYANFKGEWLKQYDTAIIYYNKAYEASTTVRQRMKIHNELGNAYFLKNELIEAHLQFEEAQKIFMSKKTYPIDYPSSVAETYVNLGMLSNREKQYALSDSFFRLAEHIYRTVQSKDSTQLIPEFARLLTNRALNLRQMSMPVSEIKNLYFEAIDLYKKANKSETVSLYSRHLGRVHNLLAVLYHYNKNYTQADTAYRKALEIQTNLVEQNPIAFEIDLANTTYNYGLNLCKLNDSINAKKNIWQAKTIFNKRLQSDSTRVIAGLLACNHTLAGFYEADSLVSDALSLYDCIFYSLQKPAYTTPLVNGKNYTDILLKLVEINTIIVKKEVQNSLRQNFASRRIDNLLVEFLSYQKWYVQKCDSAIQKQNDRIKTLSSAYRDLSWAYIYNKSPKKAEESARMALDFKKDQPSLWCLFFSLLLQNDGQKDKESKSVFIELSDGYNDKKLKETITLYLGNLEQAKYTDTTKLQKKIKRWLPEVKDTATK